MLRWIIGRNESCFWKYTNRLLNNAQSVNMCIFWGDRAVEDMVSTTYENSPVNLNTKKVNVQCVKPPNSNRSLQTLSLFLSFLSCTNPCALLLPVCLLDAMIWLEEDNLIPGLTTWTPKGSLLKGDLEILHLPKTSGELSVREALVFTNGTTSSPPLSTFGRMCSSRPFANVHVRHFKWKPSRWNPF